MQTARDELKYLNLFDYVVVNEQNHLDDTVNTILSIIDAEHHRIHPC
jgi:guanylate kinase